MKSYIYSVNSRKKQDKVYHGWFYTEFLRLKILIF